MVVYEYRSRIRLRQDVDYKNVQQVYAYFIDSALAKEKQYLEFHNRNEYKYYVFDMPWPMQKNETYKKNHIYTVRIRTVKKDLAEYFSGKLPFHETKEIQGVGGELRIIPKKIIKTLYSITPVVEKTDKGYWRGNLTLEEYEQRLKVNLIKKYKRLTGEDLQEDFSLYDVIRFNNQKPIKLPYKSISLLGDKLNLEIATNETAQKLAYLAIGTGLGELGSRGMGFTSYRYL